MTLSDLMISAARALRAGAHANLVRDCLLSDGVTEARVETIMRWCQLYNERCSEEPGSMVVTDDQNS